MLLVKLHSIITFCYLLIAFDVISQIVDHQMWHLGFMCFSPLVTRMQCFAHRQYAGDCSISENVL